MVGIKFSKLWPLAIGVNDSVTLGTVKGVTGPEGIGNSIVSF